VIGAHYDSAQGAVGADDNGSGVAALLELARLLKTVQPAEGLEMRLVFYVNEELPWFATEKMGSLVHASGLARDEREVAAMLSLETSAGTATRRAASATRCPSTCSTVHRRLHRLRRQSALAKSLAPGHRLVQALRSVSVGGRGGAGIDRRGELVRQWAYWQFGWPAVMVTDTAPFRYPPLPHAARHAGQARLRPARAGGAGP